MVANLITGATLNILEVAGEAESDDDHPFADIDSEHDEKLDNWGEPERAHTSE